MPETQNERVAAHGFARPAALLVAGVVAGVITAGTLSASAQTSTPPAPASPSASSPATPVPPKEGHADETPLTGSDAEKARAAALAAVPGGTVVRLETDSGPAAYEAHMTKADGTPVTVLMDENFAVTSIEEGSGADCPDGEGDGRRGWRRGSDEPAPATTAPAGQDV